MNILRKYDLTLLKVAVCLVFFVTPLESIGISDEASPFSIVKLVALFLFMIWVFTSRKCEKNPIIRIFLLLGGYWLFSSLWALNPSVSFSRVFNFYIPSLFTIMIVGYEIKRDSDLRNVLLSYLFGCIVLAINCHISRAEILANAKFSDMERVTTFGQDQNELSFLLIMGLVIALHGVQTYIDKRVRLIFLLSAILFVYAILLTGSRTGAIMIFSVVVLFIWNNKKYTTFLLPIFILGFPIVIAQIPESSIERILETKESLSTGDVSSRGDIWNKAFRAFTHENQLLGVGYLNFPEMMKHYYGSVKASHNTYISYLINGGVIGLFFLLVILLKLYKYCSFLVKKTKNSYWFAYIFPLMIAMLTLETQHRRWMFLIAIVLYKAYFILKHDTTFEPTLTKDEK